MTVLPAAAPSEAVRLLAGWAGSGRASGAAEHHARYGPVPLGAFGGRHGRERLVELVAAAGLRGRGGAGFPTARKLRVVAAGRGRAVVVANGCEGDPASTKDGMLLELAPHLVIDGIVLAAHAVGAVEAVLCVHAGSRLVRLLSVALHERGGDPVDVRVVEVPRHYVASEESALVNFLSTGDARPTVTPPRPAERGVRGRPTLVDNVETLAQLALIARFGGEWFRGAGTPESPGTTLLTVGGAVARPGVYEIDLGRPVADVLELAGGPSERLRAVQVGGLGGTWLSLPSAAGTALTPESCGIAAMIAYPERACGVADAARVLRYLAAETAGQCGPCMFGLPAIAADMAVLAAGADPSGAVLHRLRGRLEVIPGRGACAHPDGAARFAASALRVFAEDVARHAHGRPCAEAGGPSWIPLPR